MNGVRTLKGGRIKRIEPFKRDLAPSLQLQAFAQQPYNHARIRHPMVRKSWLEKGHRAGGEGRGSDPFVRVSWEKAAKLVAGELKRVRETYDPGAIWGGSYGWMRTSSVGNARNLLQRVLNLNGGYTTYTGDYSTGCAKVVAINPLKPDTAECFGDKAQGIAPRPTDVAMMLGRTSRACASGSSPK